MKGTLRYLGLDVSRLTNAEVIDLIRDRIARAETLIGTYCNFHTGCVIGSSKETERLFRAFDLIVPDGIAVLSTSWLVGRGFLIDDRVGPDMLLPHLYREASRLGWKIYFLGSEAGIVAAAARRLRAAYPELQLVGLHHGYLKTESEQRAVIEEIKRTEPQVVIVGMGQPIQERWIVENRDQLPPAFFLGVGAYFDHASIDVTSYPKWVHRCRLYWLYRLKREPQRLWKRYTLEFVIFLAQLVLTRFRARRR